MALRTYIYRTTVTIIQSRLFIRHAKNWFHKILNTSEIILKFLMCMIYNIQSGHKHAETQVVYSFSSVLPNVPRTEL